MSEPLTLTALHPSGFEICLQVASLDVVDATIADLVRRGYKSARAGDGWQRSPTGEPFCPRHRVVMRLRSKQNQEWWSHRVIDRQTGQELFCRGHAGASSPGWEVVT
ncbi:MAG TPA: hypothetical protein VLQ80_14830 [Candidatus Saccharimonadia bacterium]|nr:hypothetical protein [Candidatus Saccharimonadia bacterium]